MGVLCGLNGGSPQTHVHIIIVRAVNMTLFRKKLVFEGVIKGPSSQSYGFSSGHVWM